MSALRRLRVPGRTVRLRLTALYGGLFLACGAALLGITYELVAHTGGPLSISTGCGAGPCTTGSTATDQTVHDRGSSAVPSLRDQFTHDLHQLLMKSGLALAIMAVAAIALGWVVAGRVLRPLRTMTATTRRLSEHNLHERLPVQGPPDELHDLGDTINGLLARLEAAFDAQRRFVANASHELRTPLALGKAMLQVALADPHLTLDSLRATCEQVLEADDEQEQLIEALLTLARSQRGLDHRKPFDLAAVTAEVVRERQPDAAARGLTLDATLVPAPVAGDTRLTRRLVSNLIENALRYNTPCGRVAVTVAARTGAATLRVANTGPPVPADQIARLLQPFQRLDPARTGEHDGLGLGLSIVAAIATAHDAALTARPGPTGGLDVHLTFPPVGKSADVRG